MKRKWGLCLALVVLIILFLVCIDFVNAESGIYIHVAGQKIALWQQDDEYYAFLPSACKDAGLEAKIPRQIDKSSVTFMYSENIPAVFIDTQSGTAENINNDKNVQETGRITVLEPDGTISYIETIDYIKGRGNTSFTEFEKKPYLVKLKESVSFLGMEAGDKWIFTSNASDSTLLRNALSRNLANHLGIPQSDEGVFVDLYLNGEYVGNYYVTEKVEVAPNRLEITDLEKATKSANDGTGLSAFDTAWTEKTKAKHIPNDPEDITGGYLIERDFNSRFLDEVEINGSYFITQSEECFIVHSPAYASEKQIAYISDFVQSSENAILSPDGIDETSGKSYEELIDVNSFVRKYLLEEVTLNYDGGVASSYFYKDIDSVSDKLFAGPAWDYDVSWGNNPSYLGYVSISPDQLTKLAFHGNSTTWFSALYDKPEFQEEVIACYEKEISSYLEILSNQILPELAETTAASAAMDQVRWQQQYLRNNPDYQNREEEIAFLSDYISDRKIFLDKAWIDKIPVYEITLILNDVVYDTLYVFEGNSLPEFPEVYTDHADVSHWIRIDDNVTPDKVTAVYQDMTFEAVVE